MEKVEMGKGPSNLPEIININQKKITSIKTLISEICGTIWCHVYAFVL